MKDKALCAFLALFLIALLPVFQPEARADSAAVQSRLDYMLTIYPNNSYFSANYAACTHVSVSSCDNCSLLHIPARGNLPKGSDTVPTSDGDTKTCFAFAKYAFYCLNGAYYNDSRNTVYTGKSHSEVYLFAKLGDYILYSGHGGIYISGDSSGFWMYEANYSGSGGTNRVGYKTHLHTQNGVTIRHAYNYGDTIIAPSSVWISPSTATIAEGETINFNFGADRPCSFMLRVQRNSADVSHFSVSGNTGSYTFDNGAGLYGVWAEASNGAGWAQSEPAEIRVGIPNVPTLSVNASNSLYATILSWNSTMNTDYYSIRIYDSVGNVIYQRDDYTSTTLSTQLPAGAYQAEVFSVRRDIWSTGSGRVDFSVSSPPETAPSNVWISPTSAVIAEGETLNISFGAAQPCTFKLRVDRNSENVDYFDVTNGSVSYTFSSGAGMYGLWIEASNGAGWAQSEPAEIRVGIPNVPTLSVNASNSLYATILSWNSTMNTDYYSIRIYDSVGNAIYQRDDYTSTTLSTHLPAGAYQAEVFSVRRNTWSTGSGRVDFSVSSPPETAPSNVWISPTSAAIAEGETLNISFGAAQPCTFKLRVDRNSENVDYFDVTDGSVSYTFNSGAGMYGLWIEASNGAGWAQSEPALIRVGIPNKPTLSVSASDSLHASTLSWNATQNTDFYSIRIYDTSGNFVYQRDDYDKTAFAALLPAGSYQAEVCGVRRDVWVTESDGVPFTVTAASPTHTPEIQRLDTAEGKLFKLYACEGTWLEDKALAEAEGGRLAVVNSQARQDCIYQMVYDFGEIAYLGAQGYSNYYWRWEDGSKVEGFTNWEGSNPDNWEGLENCMTMNYTTGTWNDFPNDNDNRIGYVAEFDAVSLSVETIDPIWLGGVDTIQDNLQVFVTFADGSSILMLGDYELSIVEGDGFVSVNVGYAGFTASRDIPTRLPDATLILPMNLAAIGEEAFTGIDAEAVLVPNGCTSIGARAFADCANLRYVIVSNLSTIDIADDALEGTEAVFVEQ